MTSNPELDGVAGVAGFSPFARGAGRVDPLAVTPTALVDRHVEDARRQLADARDRLKSARRRVTQLEEALQSWERFADEVRKAAAAGDNGPALDETLRDSA